MWKLEHLISMSTEGNQGARCIAVSRLPDASMCFDWTGMSARGSLLQMDTE